MRFLEGSQAIDDQQPPPQSPLPTKIREELEQMVLKDLLGPVGGPEEEIDEQHGGRGQTRFLAFSGFDPVGVFQSGACHDDSESNTPARSTT
jgi:hypothetical protein